MDGIKGDHDIIALAYNVTRKDVELIADTIEGVVN